MKRAVFAIMLLVGVHSVCIAQGIPDDVYYLMPSFGQGIIFFNGQAPAQGQLNICAVDNTLRFIDKSGKELSATNDENIVRVQIDSVVFMRDGGLYYRLFPVTPNFGVAVLREVSLQGESMQGAYGTETKTSAVKQYKTIYADGVAYNLGPATEYKMTERLFMYKGNTTAAFNKRNLRKMLPRKKAEIDTYFASGNSLPDTAPEAVALLSGWAE